MKTSLENVYRLKGLQSSVLSAIFVDLEMRNAAAIEGRYAISDLDEIRFIRATSRGGLYEVQRRDWHIAASANEHCFACIPFEGEIRLSQDGRVCALQPNDMGFVDTRREYSVDIPQEADALWIRVEASCFDWRLPRNRDVFARRIVGTSAIGRAATTCLRSIADQAGQLPLRSRKVFASMASDILAEAAAHIVGGSRDAAVFRTGSQRTLDRARVYIDQHLDEDDLAPARIAGSVGVSPRYLGQLFAAQGLSTMGWVTRCRLERCRSRLAKEVWRPGLIAELAYTTGFSNVSSFNRAFKSAFGMTPRETTVLGRE